jgi:hypothetical protein
MQEYPIWIHRQVWWFLVSTFTVFTAETNDWAKEFDRLDRLHAVHRQIVDTLLETTIPKVYSDAFNNVALTLSAMGVTIVVSAGDDGAASYEARNNPSGCAYRPIFPATSNYVLAVGGTQVSCISLRSLWCVFVYTV